MINTNDLKPVILQTGENVLGRYLPDGTFDPLVLLYTTLQKSMLSFLYSDYIDVILDQLIEYHHDNGTYPKELYTSNIICPLFGYAIEELDYHFKPDEYSIVASTRNLSYSTDKIYNLSKSKSPLPQACIKELYDLVDCNIRIMCYKSALKTIATSCFNLDSDLIHKQMVPKHNLYIAKEKINDELIAFNGSANDINIIDEVEYFRQHKDISKIYTKCTANATQDIFDRNKNIKISNDLRNYLFLIP